MTAEIHTIETIQYDDNITILVTDPVKSSKLKDDEYFAHLVIDTINIGKRPKSDYFYVQRGWIGLEQTTKPDRVYIYK